MSMDPQQSIANDTTEVNTFFWVGWLHIGVLGFSKKFKSLN